MQKPSIGRTVHYISYGTPGGEYKPECRAAIVTEVSKDPNDAERVGLAIQNPTGVFFNSLKQGGIPHEESDHEGGTWHWPERTE